MSRWKTNTTEVDNGTGYKIIGEIEPEHYKLLVKKGAEFSQKIMEMEELLVLTSMPTPALERLKLLIETEIKSR